MPRTPPLHHRGSTAGKAVPQRRKTAESVQSRSAQVESCARAILKLNILSYTGAAMEWLGKFIVKNRWWVLLVWVVAAAGIVTLSPSLSSVESNDESTFLPKSYESIKAADVAKKI